MKYWFLLILGLIIIGYGFTMENEQPLFMMEINTGYSIGINQPNAIPIDIKIIYPYNRFGFTLEAGMAISDDIGYRLFLGPTFFVINNPKIRLPISIGYDINGINNNNILHGIGIISSFNYRLNNMFYFTVNLNINYAFNESYNEIVGYKDAAIGIDLNGNKIYAIGPNGNPILTTPIMEKRNNFGNYIHIRPTIGIGIQF